MSNLKLKWAATSTAILLFLSVSMVICSYVFPSYGLEKYSVVSMILFSLSFSYFWFLTSSRSKVFEHKSLHDGLTGLMNRTAFQKEICAMLEETPDTKIAVMLLDLNKFKLVNDTLGHLIGDSLLIQVSKRFTDLIRGRDIVARFGGDEFAFAIVDYKSVDNLSAIANRILGCFDRPFNLAGQDTEIAASLGISHYPKQSSSYIELLKFADVAMYVAKNEHLGFYIYEKERDANSIENMLLRSSLRKAIDDNEIEVHYQPKKSLLTGAIVGVEALARWTHPTIGRISPVKFIAIAEQASLIKPLTNYVLNRAIDEFQPLYKRKLLSNLSINVSPYSLFQGDLILKISNALAKTQMVPADLILEITETSLQRSSDDIIKVLLCLDLVGLSLSIDDFGTGQSSLLYLKNLPVKEIKIDQSFVSAMLTTTQDYNIVQSIISLAHSLGCTACAEGVETKEVEDALRAMGCDLIQGYHVAKPLTLAELHLFLESKHD